MPEEPRIHNWNVNKALQKEIQRLKIENEILKKATAIFAKEQ